jgi:hypothetical protein
MTEYEPYSIRMKRATLQGEPVIFEYDRIPQKMRAHAFHAIKGSIEIAPDSIGGRDFWWRLEELIVQEHGLFHSLPDTGFDGHVPERRVAKYMQSLTADPELLLDVVEMGLRLAQEWALDGVRRASRPKKEENLRAVVDELNKRFRLHDLGFEYVGIPGNIIRVDSQFIHEAAVEPAIVQLVAKGWDGPLDEFMEAHKPRQQQGGDQRCVKVI